MGTNFAPLEESHVVVYQPTQTSEDRRIINGLEEGQAKTLLKGLRCGEIVLQDSGALVGLKEEPDHIIEYEIDCANARIQSRTHVHPDDEEGKRRYSNNAKVDTLHLLKMIRDGHPPEDAPDPAQDPMVN